ncbi:bifunctional germination protease/germinant receptor pseudoprotease CspBA, partial [Romboutsia sp.]|uniref:bifunctional germination protease/germinant receptor pseudoprotease CspBA n=1 Tax=Romboutsia sp. TaxID=1965302 RepID=UPI002CA88860
KFILDKALELKMPVAINISYGSNEGSNKELSLFEQYINDMCSFWKNNIVVAAGNNADKGGHKRINIKDTDEKVEVEFVVGENEKLLNLNIWPDFVDNFSVYLVNPSNVQTQPISLTSGEIKNIIGSTRIKGYFYPIAPYSLIRRVTIQMSSTKSISPGIWKLVFEPIDVVTGNIDIYLPTSEGISKDTKFLKPDKILTVTVPGTASKVITVGSYNSRTDTVSIFSGEGDIENGIYKPDILAPGEDIVSVLPGGNIGALSGTSMAAPHVTGVVALLMEWGIVQKNNLFLYSQKLKAVLIKGAKRKSNENYPNNSMGYGLLYLADVDLDSLAQINQQEIIGYRNSKKKTKKHKIRAYDNRQIDLNVGINIIHRPGFEEDLKTLKIPYRYYKISYNGGILYISENNLEDVPNIANLTSILRLNFSRRMALLGEISPGISQGVVATEDIGANFFKNNPNISVTGRGIAIGITSTGIDYLHEDFIYPDGTSKILYLWDQTKEGNPPEGFFIGTEYTREDLNQAIANKDSSLSKDEEGHGTMISGICAGLGNINKEYAGVAEEADLIVVKLQKIDGFYNSGTLLPALQYLYEKAYAQKIPVVVYISLGTSQIIETNPISLSERAFFTRGVCYVSAIGNEGDTQTHTSGTVRFKGEQKDIEVELTQDEDILNIQVWISKPDKVEVAIITPTGESSKVLQVSNYNVITGLFDIEGTEYSIIYIYPSLFSGQQQISISLKNAKKGIWKIRLIGDYITNGIYHAYLENRVFLKSGTKFRETDPLYTTTYPSTFENIISIGAYDTINNSLWPTSSRGPTITGEPKPDIVAPGVNIIAPYPGNTYATITGTSPAAAYASGAVALFMQYVLEDVRYRDKAFVSKIRTYLTAGATRDNNITYPNSSYGYGELNIRGIFDQLK